MISAFQKSIFIALFLLTAFCSYRIYEVEQEKRQLKSEEIELSHIKYGLFNVDEWKLILADIIDKKIEAFEINKGNEAEIQKKVEGLLNTLIDEVEKLQREKNSKSLGGMLKQLITEVLVDFDEIREEIPTYAKAIIKKLNDPVTKAELKNFVSSKIEEYADETVGRMDYSLHDGILVKYNQETRQDCIALLQSNRIELKKVQQKFIFGLIALVVISMVFLFIPKIGQSELLISILAALSLLIAGVLLPMIDIEASIESFSFQLMGESVQFTDQVLFFQSKSILEVISVLIQNGKIELILVALLVFSFSVLFPITKLIISVYLLSIGRSPRNGFTKFMVYKSAKWSMADVLVVALFMAYIGFSGIINAQLTQLERNTGNLEIFTTDNSTLQLGFYVFTAFVLFSLLISTKLEIYFKQLDMKST